MANNNNKPWYEKVGIWVTTFAAIFTVLGISIFGGKPLFKKEDDSTSVTNLNDNGIKIGDQSPVINGNNNIINYENTNQDTDLSSKSYSLASSENNMEEIYHQGTITKTGWESKFIGLRYTNPEGMSMSTEGELDEMNEFEGGSPSIVFSQDELGYVRLTTVIEMMSKSDDQSVIVGICVERLIDDVDISQFIEGFESQTKRHPFYNYTLLSDDEIVRIGNNDYIKVSYMVDFNNVFRYQDSYFRVVGDRVIMILFNYNDERARDNVLDAFTAY